MVPTLDNTINKSDEVKEVIMAMKIIKLHVENFTYGGNEIKNKTEIMNNA
jgi:hypothetical protein